MRFSSYAAVGAVASLAAAQTFTDCNPMEKDCPNNPAMPQTWETDFTAGKDAVKGWKQTAGSLNYGSSGADFVVAKKGDAPTIGSEAYLHFGYVEVTMKAAPGQGIISSIVLQSDDLDEVDWEWIGGVNSRVQTNYFGKGNTTTYDRMIEANVANNQNDFHVYALNWTAEAITWLIDSKPVRTLKYADANGGKTFPQTPCNIRLGNWPGGDSENKGTVEWAGGKVDYTKAPFTMTVKNIKVINYSPGLEYNWSDKSGTFGSIKVIGEGNTTGAPQNLAQIEASATVSSVPLASDVNAPNGTAGAEVSATATATATAGSGSGGSYGSPAKASTCTEGASGSMKTKTVTGATQGTGAPNKGSEASCECAGTTTVYKTGTAPPAVPATTVKTQVSSIRGPATAVSPPPSAAAPTGGIAVDTRSAPTAGLYTPTAAGPRPSGNATTSAPPLEISGNAGSQNKAGVVLGALVGGVVMLAI